MPDIARQRCLQHPQREAVARCPECGYYFCRECVTEHERRVLCTACLQRTREAAEGRTSALATVIGWGLPLLSFFGVWVFFYYVARLLLSVPVDVHEGTFWQTAWWKNL